MLVDKVGSISKAVSSPTNDIGHEFDCFAKSVASQLKVMPLSLALEAQQYIQNYLCQLRIQNLSKASSSTTHVPIHTSYVPYSSPSSSWSSQPSTPTDGSYASHSGYDILAESYGFIRDGEQ